MFLPLTNRRGVAAAVELAGAVPGFKPGQPSTEPPSQPPEYTEPTM